MTDFFSPTDTIWRRSYFGNPGVRPSLSLKQAHIHTHTYTPTHTGMHAHIHPRTLACTHAHSISLSYLLSPIASSSWSTFLLAPVLLSSLSLSLSLSQQTRLSFHAVISALPSNLFIAAEENPGKRHQSFSQTQ